MSLILQTSGSTGEPKFHSTDNARLAQILSRDIDAMGIAANDRLLTFCPLNHGLGLYAVLAALSAGGAVILPHQFSRESLIAGLAQHPTWMVAVPPVLDAMYWAGRGDDRLKPLLSTVRFVRVGGAPLERESEEQFEKLFGIPVLNGYGCTEIPCITRSAIQGDNRRAGSVGKPVPGITVIIGNPAGEIWVSEDAGAHWHNTEDVGHFDSDGFLYIDQAHKPDSRKTWKEREVTC